MINVVALSLAASLSTAEITRSVTSLSSLSAATRSIETPDLTIPDWLKKRRMVVTYDVTTKGLITANIDEFKDQANATLNDSRGWTRMGVYFKEVAREGMFTLALSQASQMASFSPFCGTEYSCRTGRNVVINQDRWLGATVPWNQSGGSLRGYRHMVINHEVGHWLGHDHSHCGGLGQLAPVMMQQSINLAGCKFNPWPVSGELWSSQLGIKLP